MNCIIRIRALSINAAYQGRRFSTPEKKKFDRVLALMLPKQRVVGDYYRVAYDFHLRNFGNTDSGNLIKVLEDCIVRQGIITDDRRVVEHRIRKFPSTKDFIVIEIERTEKPTAQTFIIG